MLQRTNLSIYSNRTKINNNDKIIFNDTNSFKVFSMKKYTLNAEIPYNSTLFKYLRILLYALNFSFNIMNKSYLSIMNCL